MLSRLKSHLPDFAIALLLFVLLSGTLNLSFFSAIRDKINFTLFSTHGEQASSDIVIVALDDATLNTPNFLRYQDISRADYAKVLTNILSDAPKAIGVDTFFYNPSERKSDDEALKYVLEMNKNIIIANEFDTNQKQFLSASEVIGMPFSRQGYINLISSSTDTSIVINQVPMLENPDLVQEITHEPFIIRLLRIIKGIKAESIRYDADTESYHLFATDGSAITIPAPEQRMNINFFGSVGAYKRYSFYDIWQGKYPLGAFDGKIVLIGATAKDIHDEFVTPRSGKEAMPGVEIHANALQTLLSKEFVTYQDRTSEIVMLGSVLLLLVFLFLVLPFRLASIASLLSLPLSVGVAMLLFRFFHLVIDFSLIFVAILAFWGALSLIRYFKEEKEKRMIRSTFSRYVAKEVVDEILKNPGKVQMGGETKEVTCFFSDLAGFTNISEKLTSQEVMELLNEYLGKMSAVVMDEGGTIDKYMGDAIMAFWGAPLPCEDHAARAVRTALKQWKALPEINAKLAAKGLPPVSMRIGINSGLVNAGNVGTEHRIEYTVIGDNVNLASRLEGINKEYGTHRMISEATKKLLPEGEFLLRELDTIRVKGKKDGVKVFEVMAFTTEITPEQQKVQKVYELGLSAYRSQQWEKAEECLKSLPDDPASQVLLKRVSFLKGNPPEADWDGVYTFTTK